MAKKSFHRSPLAFGIAVLLRLVAIAAFIILTNAGFWQRVTLLQDQERWVTLVGFVGIWGMSLVALAIVAFHRSLWVRGFWALVVGVTTGVGFAYRQASGTEFGIFDAISLWSARHEAARAMDFYGTEMIYLALVIAAGVMVLAMPPILRVAWLQRWLSRFAWTPALPVALIAAIIVVKEGGGAQVLPTQFAPMSVGLVAASKLATETVPKRENVAWTPGPHQARHIVMLVDESVRADYLDLTPGNPYTPELARLKAHVVDFGPAASAGNCSHYSNALLRFAAARDRLGSGILKNPTIWQSAKRAGYRTVYIDAQSAFNRNPGKLQNFMTAEEAVDIDRIVTMPESTPAPELDDRLLDAVVAELRSPEPVFIYANKNGAHFPYDNGYPASERLFQPTMTEAMHDATRDRVAKRTLATYVAGGPMVTRINSYRNALRWTVDRFFKRMFAEVNLDDAVVLYTSDHGQQFDPSRLSHCTVDNPDPREALVPLLAIAGNDALRDRLAGGAAANRGHASHFALAPTLFNLFGYAPRDVATMYGPTLFEKDTRQPGFTTGDIFGLFSDKVRWHPLDPTQPYLEPEATSTPRRQVSSRAAAVPVSAH